MLRVACLQLCLLSTLAHATLPAASAEPPTAGSSRGQLVRGERLALLPDALQLRPPESRLWEKLLLEQQGANRYEHNIRKATLAGFVVGGLTGVGFGFLTCTASETSPPSPLPCALVGGLVGGLLGAAIGGLVGMALPEGNDSRGPPPGWRVHRSAPGPGLRW